MKTVTQQKKEINSDKLITDLSQLTIDTFIQCLFRKNYNVLILSGTPYIEEIKNQWNVLYEQYVQSVGNPIYEQIRDNLSQLVKLQSDLLIIRTALVGFSLGYNNELAGNLTKIGINLTFDISNMTEFSRNITILISKAKSKEVKIAMIQNQVEKLEKDSNHTQATEADFRDGITTISRYMGFIINPNIVDMNQYASYQRSYSLYYQRQKQTQK